MDSGSNRARIYGTEAPAAKQLHRALVLAICVGHPHRTKTEIRQQATDSAYQKLKCVWASKTHEAKSEPNLTALHAKLQLVSALSAQKKRYICTYVHVYAEQSRSLKYHEYSYDKHCSFSASLLVLHWAFNPHIRFAAEQPVVLLTCCIQLKSDLSYYNTEKAIGKRFNYARAGY